ncbi:MAG: RluA family pseudouridine synthase [Oscillospiraceae bacterium]
MGASIYPVHRLDQAVGGVMVFAKTERMAAKLSKAIQEGKLQKEYLAVLTKRPEEDSGELHDLLFHDRFKNKTFVVSKERKGVKKAALSYRVLAESNGRCLVHVRLSTGRTHQIRVQFASRGCPLVGDGKYGSRVNAASPALWSYALTLPGAGGKEERFCVQPEMQGAWEPFSDALSHLDSPI